MKPYILVVLICVGVIGAIAFAFSSNQGENLPIQENTPAKEQELLPTNTTNQPAMELKIEDVKVGEGTEAKAGNTVTVHYTGMFTDGKKFDSSYDRGQPFSFPLGQGMVIKGWEQGVAGMKVGGKRKLTIPPSLGYGEEGVPGAIPPNSTLLFEVELLDVK